MSEPGNFVFVRDGHKRVYIDHWAGLTLCRDILYGPDALESFAEHFSLADQSELDEFEDPGISQVIVDFDQKTLQWSADADALALPRVKEIYIKLLQQAWPGFTLNEVSHYSEDGLDDWLGNRDCDISDAGRMYYEEDDLESDGERFDQDETRAWVSVISKQGTAIHRQLEELTVGFFQPSKDLVTEIRNLEDVPTPPELTVKEGAWIDLRNKEYCVWGDDQLKTYLPEIQSAWKGWNVRWASRGYQEQCEACGVAYLPASDAELVGKFAPMVLSTIRFDAQLMINAVGDWLKGVGVKAFGCLYILIAIPILIFAAFSSQWMAAGVSLAVILIIFAIVFQVIKAKLRRNFRADENDFPNQYDGPTAAGPLDLDERKAYFNRLLTQTGLPSLDEVAKHCDLEELNTLENL